MATLSSSITTYLNQWLKIASGRRVVIQRHIHGWAGSDYIIFRCNTCMDNWHVGTEHFYSGKDPVGIPSVLQDWVAKHRHVCTKYINDKIGECNKCGWPYEAHEQSWLDKKSCDPPKSFWVGAQGHKASCNYITAVTCNCGWTNYCNKNFAEAKAEVDAVMAKHSAILNAVAPKVYTVKKEIEKVTENVGRKFRED